MPRQAIIALLVVLIVSVLGGTAAMVLGRLQGMGGTSMAAQSIEPGELPVAEIRQQQIPTENNLEELVVLGHEEPLKQQNINEEQAASVNPSVLAASDFTNPGTIPRADLERYLAVANNQQVLAGGPAAARALRALVENDDTRLLEAFISFLETYRGDLAAISSVPEPADKLHQLLLAHADALLADFQKAVLLWDYDQAETWSAIREIDILDRKNYPLIRSEIARLNKLAGIEL